MVKQMASNSTIDGRPLIPIAYSPSRRPVFRGMLIVAFVFAATLPVSKAESLASKNEEGNRLFAQSRFEDAEKAYLEAQGKAPGKPEILYNLGNSLIKQKKYDRGIQALHQSMNQGNQGVKESSWYNTGNAFFSMGKFKDSAEAYIQALKLDPSDQDAKHNLELALLKLKQQESKQQNENSNQNRRSAGQNGSMASQTPPSAPREGSISREQALQILKALQSRELEDQRELLERRATQRTDKKDW
jgi:Ca-activated chloride channel homolog